MYKIGDKLICTSKYLGVNAGAIIYIKEISGKGAYLLSYGESGYWCLISETNLKIYFNKV